MGTFFEAFGVNIPTLVAQLVNFLLLLGLLYLVAYKPIMKMMDERSQRIKESVDQTEAIKEQAAHAEEEVKKQLEKARGQSQEVINRATKTAEEIRAKAQQEARQEGDALIEKARQEISRERDTVIGEIRGEFADLTIMAAEKVIGRSLDKETHRELIDRVLRETPMNKG